MPPRTFRDLTEEELQELQASLTPRAAVPPLPLGGASRGGAPWRVQMGSASILDEIDDDLLKIEPGGDDSDTDAWLDDLMAAPPSAPARPMLSAAGPGAKFTGEDTPQARALVQQRGMQITSPPTDDELLDPSAFQRSSTMPELDDGMTIDDLIAAEGQAMDREQQAAAQPGGPGQQAAPRSRYDEMLELLQPPTRMQGIAAALGDAFFGGNRSEGLQQRQRAREGALAQARMQDIAAGERADEQAYDRSMADARLGVTMRGQDLADARAAAGLRSAEQRAEQADQRQRELQTQRDAAAMERAQIMAQGRARNEAPELSPEQERAGLANYLAGEANTSLAEAETYLAGKIEGLAPGKAERLRGIDAQLKTLPPAQRATTMAQAMGRTGARRDQDEPKRLEARTDLLSLHRKIKEASDAWRNMSEKDKRVLATVGGGDSWLASTARDAGLSEQGQVQAAAIQALADMQIKLQSGASVTANEWRRVATEIGLPKDAFSPFNSPATLGAWLQKSVDGFRDTQKSVLATYSDLLDDMEEP